MKIYHCFTFFLSFKQYFSNVFTFSVFFQRKWALMHSAYVSFQCNLRPQLHFHTLSALVIELFPHFFILLYLYSYDILLYITQSGIHLTQSVKMIKLNYDKS